jgi:hypothetical protein
LSLPPHIAICFVVLHERERITDRREWIPQLVGERGQEFILAPVRVFCRCRDLAVSLLAFA